MLESFTKRALAGLVCLLTAAAAATSFAPAASASPLEAFSWGRDQAGELGNGMLERFTTAPGAIAGLTNPVQLSGGEESTLALLEGGTVMAWGRNTHGELGNGTTTPSDVPVSVPGLEDVVAVSEGENFGLALLSDGTVMAWGDGAEGQLGDDSTVSSDVPVPVSELGEVTAISARGTHALALLGDGKVMSWGANSFGQLGDGTTEKSDRPLEVSALGEVAAVAAGGTYSLALLSDGAVRAWGANTGGELGDDTTTPTDTPIEVAGLGSGVTAIAAGDEDSMALRGGAVLAWGRNTVGQLGNGKSGTNEKALVPEAVVGLSEAATAISNGGETSLALLGDRHVVAWGGNEKGELGIGGAGKGSLSATPVLIPSLCRVVSLTAADFYELAMAEAGEACLVVTGLKPTSGSEAGGTSVEISGSGFTGASTVDFGSNEATSFKVSSETSITAVSPAGTGTVPVTVTVGGAVSAPGPASSFTYLEPAVPTITLLSPKKGPQGTTVTVHGANLGEVSQVDFGATPGEHLELLSASELRVTAPTGIGTVNVTAKNPNGTSAISKKARFKYSRARK